MSNSTARYGIGATLPENPPAVHGWRRPFRPAIAARMGDEDANTELARRERTSAPDRGEPGHDHQGEREGRRLGLRARSLPGDALQGAVAEAARPRRRAPHLHPRERRDAQVEELVPSALEGLLAIL